MNGSLRTRSILAVVGLLGAALLITGCAGNTHWQEGERFAVATNDQRNNTSVKPTASGAASLFGPALDRKGLTVEYRFELKKPVPQARIAFRYARLHWRETMVPAAIQMDLTGPDVSLTNRLAFPDTKGWGKAPADWSILEAPVGDLPAGEWTLKLTSLADNNSVNLDGFLIAGADETLSAEELAAMIRLQVDSDGYVGLRLRSATIRQDLTKTLPVAVRSFGRPADDPAVRIVDAAGESVDLNIAQRSPGAEGAPDILRYGLPKLSDGTYTLVIRCDRPTCEIELPLVLLGEFLSTFDARLAKVEAFAQTLAASDAAGAAACRADFEHAVAFLQAGREMMGKSTARPDDASVWKKHLAQHEGLSDPAPLAVNMAKTLEQAETTMARLSADEAANPYAGRVGEFRRAFHSTATGALRVYRSWIPAGYDRAESVPMVLMLHGGGGDENTFHDMDDGVVLDALDKRGYLMVTPHYHRRNHKEYMSDLTQLIELTRKQYPKIDPRRIYVTGISMGGAATYQMTTTHPDLFAAGCVVSGGGDPAAATALETTPMLFLHGGGDTVVVPSRSRVVAEKMKELGYTVERHVFPSHGHEYHGAQYIKLTLDFFDRFTKPKK